MQKIEELCCVLIPGPIHLYTVLIIPQPPQKNKPCIIQDVSVAHAKIITFPKGV